LGHYNPVLWFGYAVWVIAAGVQTTFARSTTHAYIVGILFVEGFGVGWTLQTALVAAQAIAPAKDRAVITGIRNLFRYTGGSFGLAISSAIMNNIINSKLATSDLPKTIVDQINGAEFNIPAGLTAEQSHTLLDAEMEGMKGVFWFLFAVSLLTFLFSLIVEDHGLPEDKKPDEKEDARQQNMETRLEDATEIQREEGDTEKTDLAGQG
jgi:fucose permease